MSMMLQPRFGKNLRNARQQFPGGLNQTLK
jgi:hypothetical protein